MAIVLPPVNPDQLDKLRDAQLAADQKIVNELNDKIERLESKVQELKVEVDGLQEWLKSEKMTHKMQYFGYGRFM
jgi:predicted translin family RNA/ssDNA-binding protein